MNYLVKFPLFCSLILSCLISMSYASDAHAKARHGLHGMLLFSDGDALYASHLPMFHAPHDVQLIFRFTLADKKIESELVKALDANKPYWTLAP